MVGGITLQWSVQRGIAHALLLVRRTKEEIALLKKEMHNTLSYWTKRKAHLNQQLLVFQGEEQTAYTRGAQCLLNKLLWEAEFHLSKARGAFELALDHDESLSADSVVYVDADEDSDASFDDADSDYFLDP